MSRTKKVQEYTFRTTKGNTKTFSRTDVLKAIENLFKKRGVENPSLAMCEDYIDYFVNKFLYWEKD